MQVIHISSCYIDNQCNRPRQIIKSRVKNENSEQDKKIMLDCGYPTPITTGNDEAKWGTVCSKADSSMLWV